MAEETGQEKTEEPTARRLQEARKKGDVPKSVEIASVAVLLAGLFLFYGAGEYMLDRLYVVMRHYLGNAHLIKVVPDNMVSLAADALWFSAQLVAPVLIVVFLAALAANFAQVGFFVSSEALTPKLDKIDPIAGFGRLFSKQAMANFVKSVAKLVIVGYVAYTVVRDATPQILPLIDQEPVQILVFLAKTSFWIFLKAVLIIAILAGLDYVFQRWQFRERLKMTKQELRDEARMTEGDPQVKGRIRSIQYQMARRRMMAEVPKADVIITNPIHLALALHYDGVAMEAPTLLAKGAGVIAERIKEIAREHSIPIVEDKPLAQALYKSVEIGNTIPGNLYQAVAEVLAHVYSLRKKSA